MYNFPTRIVKIVILIVLTTMAVLINSKISESEVKIKPLFWTASAMEAIELHQPSPVVTDNDFERLRTVQLKAAKGEYEAFQIVIQAPPGNLKNLNVTVSDLTSFEGSLITKNNITLYREHYIKLDNPTHAGWSANPTRGQGWYADALIPFVDPNTGQDIQQAKLDAVPFDLAAGTNQPIWVDIFVPPSTVPGQYQGKFTVESDRGISEGQIDLTVWNFTLPTQPSMDSFFDIWEDRGIEAQTLLLQHKLMSSQRIKYPNQPDAFEQLGVKSVRLPFWSGANYQTCKM
ncbi:MAG: DUF4091 domain-containing protein, partial [Waterburya sp.]